MCAGIASLGARFSHVMQHNQVALEQQLHQLQESSSPAAHSAAASATPPAGVELVGDCPQKQHNTFYTHTITNAQICAGPVTQQGQQQQDMECIQGAFTPVGPLGIRSLPDALHPGYRLELQMQTQTAGVCGSSLGNAWGSCWLPVAGAVYATKLISCIQQECQAAVDEFLLLHTAVFQHSWGQQFVLCL